jgi:2'-5' RNA ligase
MEKLTEKWAIIALLEPVEEGIEFLPSHFPLHVTIAGVFAVDFNGNTLSEKLSELLAGQTAVETVADGEQLFGPNKDVAVIKLQKTPDLMALYDKIHNELIGLGAVFNEPQYEEGGYIPHSTRQEHKELHTGEIVLINSISIVDLFPNNNGYLRKIFKTIKFD